MSLSCDLFLFIEAQRIIAFRFASGIGVWIYMDDYELELQMIVSSFPKLETMK